MEVLLLDTTEQEGEDNTLYHYVHCNAAVGCFSPSRPGKNAIRWLDLHGVLAAAVGATTSLCGEPLQFARFGGANTDGATGIVGFVNMYEVLYALVFSSTNLPTAIVQYYTRSSCDLLLSQLGYPDAKLSQWRRRGGGSISSATLSTQLDAIFKGVFSVIEHDLSFGSSLHFVFDGRVPAVNYPLELTAKLAALDAPFDTPTSSQKYSVVGRSVFYQKQLVFSTMRSDFLRMLHQWLLSEQFTPDSSVTVPCTSSSEGSGRSTMRLDTHELHDVRFARHGEYPKRHALLVISHSSLQLVFLVERKLELEGQDGADSWAKTLSDNVDQRCVQDLATFCSAQLETYLNSTRTLRQQRTEALQAQYAHELQREPVDEAVTSQFLWYSVALDRLRGVIVPDELSARQETHDSVLVQFVQHLATSQQSSSCPHDATPDVETSPELPSGIPPLKLNVDDPHALFLREKVAAEADDDISVGDAHIFPPSHNTRAAFERKGRMRRQTAERIVVRGQPLWIIASSYETLEFFSVLDAALPLELLDHELNRLCAFGGAEAADAVVSES